MIPEWTARDIYHLRSPESLLIETDVGAASLLSRQAPLALDPTPHFG
jgi:hypothetical protein